jgi:hypothetical protein
LLNGLPAAMYRCGAAPSGFGSSRFVFRDSYILIGTAGIGQGNGNETLLGVTQSWVQTSAVMVNGVWQIGGASLAAYADLSGQPTTLSAVSPSEGTKLAGIATGADVTGANTAADTSYVNGEGSSALRIRVTTAATTAAWPNLTGAIPTSVDNTYAISGNNLLPNSNATQVCNWVRGYSPNGSTFDINPAFAKLYWDSSSYSMGGTDMNNMVVHQSNVAPGSSDGSGDTAVACDIYPQDANSANISIPVVAGEKVVASIYINNHRCSSFTYLVLFNSSGTPLAYIQGNVVGNMGTYTNTLSSYARSACGAIAPAGVAYATMFIRKLNTIAGYTESYTFWAAPQLEKTNPNQTTPSPYSPGPASSVKQLGYTGALNATLGANRRNLPQVFGGGAQLRYSVQPLSTGSATDTIYIAAHTVGDGMGTAISYGAGSIAGLAAGVNYAVYEDDPTYAGGTRTYLATTDRSVLVANSGRRWLGDIYTPASVGAATPPPTGGGAGGGAPSGNPLP